MNTDHVFIHVVDGKYQAYESLSGIDRRNLGPKWPDPKSAAAYIDSLASIPDVSPLRAPSSGQDELTPLGAVVDGSPAPSGALDSPIETVWGHDGLPPTAGFWPDPLPEPGG